MVVNLASWSDDSRSGLEVHDHAWSTDLYRVMGYSFALGPALATRG